MARSFMSALNQMAREGARAQRAAARAQASRTREIERQQRASLRAQQEAERAALKREKEYDKEMKRRYLESRKQEAKDLTDESQETLAFLDQILSATLKVNDTIQFKSLYPNEELPQFRPPALTAAPTPFKPNQETFFRNVHLSPGLVERLTGIGRSKREQQIAQAEQRYAQALADYEQALELAKAIEGKNAETVAKAKEAHELAVSAVKSEIAAKRAEVDSFEAAYNRGERDAVESYCSMVLERSDYGEDFPQEFSVAYIAESRELVVEYELPSFEIVPEHREYRYVQTRDEIQEVELKPKDRNGYYERLVAAIALRSLHELFEADQRNLLDSVVFNGLVDTVDRATGNTVRPCLITVQATKSEFIKFDLAHVDVVACVKRLKAHVSPSMLELAPVKPIVEFNMVDRRFIQETDVLSHLDDRTNLLEMDPFDFEHLVCNLFSKIGLEARLTRSSRDGGVDVVAFDPRPVFGGKYVIQAKRYRNTVEVAAVRDLYGSMMNENAAKGILVTTSTFGPDARSFAKEKPIELIDGNHLLYLLDEHGIKAKIVMPS